MEFERSQISERTKAGMEAARRRGVHIGRPRKLNDDQIGEARRRIATGETSFPRIARTFGVSAATLSRALLDPQSRDSRPSELLISDQLAEYRRFRVLSIVDDHSRFCPSQIADVSIPEARITRFLHDLTLTLMARHSIS